MKRWLKIVAAAFMSAALVLTMIPLPDGEVFADCAEDEYAVSESEAACESEPADHLITPDMIPDTQTGEKDKPKKAVGDFINTAEIPMLVVVIGFNNNMHYSTEYDWGKILFDPMSSRSLPQFYKEMSYGKFTFEPVKENSKYGTDGNTNKNDKVNDGIVHVNVNMNHYQWKSTRSDNSENGKKMLQAFVEATNKAMDYVDDSFISLDADGNKWLDEEELALAFIVAGYDSGSSLSGYSDNFYLKSHRSTLDSRYATFGVPGSERYHPMITRGSKTVYMNSYVAISENCETSKGLVNGRVGSLAHELGHQLSLPDLYDTGSKTGPWKNYLVRDLSLMAHGSWAKDENGNYSPASLDPWCRIALGWNTSTDATLGLNTVTAQDYSDYTKKIP